MQTNKSVKAGGFGGLAIANAFTTTTTTNAIFSKTTFSSSSRNALGDIGKHFPDTSGEFKGIDSRILLRRTAALIAEMGYRIVNIDGTIIAERPKIAPHVTLMRERIAEDLGLPVAAVSVKATTTEKMGFAGREEGIAAAAVVLIDS